VRFLKDDFEKISLPEDWRPWLLRNVRADLCAKSVWYHGRTGRWLSARMLFSDGSGCSVLYRAMQACRRWRLAPLTAALYKLIPFLTGAVIGRGAQFGPGLVVLHSVGVVINSAVKGGTNVIVESGATLGAEKGKSPVLGDCVFIGSGAKVLGGIIIGGNVRIGANAVVLDDVPNDATAVGVPARVVRTRSERGADALSSAEER